MNRRKIAASKEVVEERERETSQKENRMVIVLKITMKISISECSLLRKINFWEL